MNRLYILLVLSLLQFSCNRADFDDLAEEPGYLSLSVIQIDEAIVDQVQSRVGADNDFYLEIYKEGKLVEGGKYLPSDAFPQKLALLPGAYTYKVYNEEYNQYKQWTDDNLGAPVYYYEGNFTIASGTTMNLSPTVSMVVCGVKLVLAQQFVAQAHSLALEVGSRKLTIQNGQTAYFPIDELSQLKYQFGMTNADGESFVKEQKIYDGKLQANTIYEIHVDVGAVASVSLE